MKFRRITVSYSVDWRAGNPIGRDVTRVTVALGSSAIAKFLVIVLFNRCESNT